MTKTKKKTPKKKTPSKKTTKKKGLDLLAAIFAAPTEEEAATLWTAREDGVFPDTFTPMFDYKQQCTCGSEIAIRPGVLCLDVSEGEPPIKFAVKDFQPRNIPALPLRGWGHVTSVPWTYDQFWAVDANCRPWLDTDHYGDALEPCTKRQIVAALKHNEEAITQLHDCFGWKSVLPSWCGKAFRSGWLPPVGYDEDNYAKYNWKK